jgi:predicted CoA-binding protein
MTSENVAILGASDKPERYSNKAMCLLEEYGHSVFLVHPNLTQINGHKVLKSLGEISNKINTLAMYISPKLSMLLIDEIIKLRPKRVIFNPGTENPQLFEKLLEHNIPFEQSCVLVLLRSNQF